MLKAKSILAEQVNFAFIHFGTRKRIHAINKLLTDFSIDRIFKLAWMGVRVMIKITNLQSKINNSTFGHRDPEVLKMHEVKYIKISILN